MSLSSATLRLAPICLSVTSQHDDPGFQAFQSKSLSVALLSDIGVFCFLGAWFAASLNFGPELLGCQTPLHLLAPGGIPHEWPLSSQSRV